MDPDQQCLRCVDVMNKFTQTVEVLWRKGMAQPLSERERTSTLASTGFYCFPVSLHQRRFSFIILRFTLSDYFLQITKKKCCKRRRTIKVINLVTFRPWDGLAQTLVSCFRDVH